MKKIPADFQFFLKLGERSLANIGIAVVALVAFGVVAHCLFQCAGNADIIHDQTAFFVFEYAVHTGNRLHEIVTGHWLIHIHCRQRRHIKTGEPHIHHNGDFQRIIIILELDRQLFPSGFVADHGSPVFWIIVAVGHHHGDLFLPCRTQLQHLPVNTHGYRPGVSHDHGFSGQFLRPVVFVMGNNIFAERFYGLRCAENAFHLPQFFFAFFNNVRFGILCKKFIFRVDLFQDLFVKVQMNHAAFVKDRACCAIFHSLSHIVNVDIVTENLAGVAVFLRNRSTCKTNKCCIWETVPNDPGGSDVDFTVLIDFFKAVLSPVSFIGHNHDIAPLRKGRTGFFKLLHSGKNNSVCFPIGEKFFQILPAGSLLRDLAEKLLALGKLPIELIVKIVAVGQNHDGGTVEFLLEQVSIKDH